jgi:hypothetical protein
MHGAKPEVSYEIDLFKVLQQWRLEYKVLQMKSDERHLDAQEMNYAVIFRYQRHTYTLY